MSTDTTRPPWQLARLADCSDPDTPDSPGARFLAAVATHVAELAADYPDDIDEDSSHEVADAAVPVYTHELWRTFVDLAAYNEDPTELGASADNMDQCARVALYMIAERLARALFDEAAGDDDEDKDEA